MNLRNALALFVATALLGACGRAPAPRDERPRPVRYVTVAQQASTVALTLPAAVQARVETRYGFRVGGKIASRGVSVGDTVVAGQVLARLDPQDREPARNAARSQVDAAETELRLARVEMERLNGLFDRGYVSRAQVDRQRAATDAAEARARGAAAQWKQAANDVAFQTLRADTAGVVTAIDAEEGQVVAAGQSVVRVARSGAWELLVDVPERELAVARAAATWQVRIPALGDQTYSAAMRELSPLADASSRTFAMRLSLQSPVPGIALGMSASVKALRSTTPAFELPLTALHSRDGNPRVWRIGVDDRVELVDVRTAGFLDESVRVVDGLAEGDRIVTAGANLLVAGQQVRVLEIPEGGDAR